MRPDRSGLPMRWQVYDQHNGYIGIRPVQSEGQLAPILSKYSSQRIKRRNTQNRSLPRGGGRWDFRFCGFGQCLVRFFGFLFLKTAVFRFWGLPRFAGFPGFSLWFSVSSTMMAVFRILLFSALYSFSCFAKEVTPRSRSKTGHWVIPRDLIYSILPFLLLKGMDNKPPSLFRAVIWVVMEKLKITSKQRTISQISRGWDNIWRLWS